MAGVDSIIGGISGKANPLISFRSIVDLDMSLIKLFIIEYQDNEIFNFTKVKSMSYIEILSEIYKRKYQNPLYFLLDDKYKNKDLTLIDNVYLEYLTTEEDKVLKYAVGTDIFKLITTYKESGDIIPYILYYNDIEKDFLDNVEEFKNIEKISLAEATARKYSKQITQYFFKDIEEVQPFCKLEDKTFYFSSCGLNLVEDNDDMRIDNDLVREIYNHRSMINIYDMYRMDIIGKYKIKGSDIEDEW